MASVKDVVGEVDLAVITTPASTVPGLMKDCAESGERERERTRGA